MIDYEQKVIEPGNRVSKLARKINVASYHNCPAVHVVRQPGNFRAPDGYIWQKHILAEMMEHTIDPVTREVTEWRMRELPQNDGAGGKPQFFTLVGTPEVFRMLGWEIITMSADDIARHGGLPTVITNDLQMQRVTELNFPLIRAALFGYSAALKKSRLVSITGETAVMEHSITAFCDDESEEQLILTWSAACIGLSHRDREINTGRIAPDMPIVGFWEPGLRCNGGGFFTELFLHRYPSGRFHENDEAMRLAKLLTVPSRSYARTVTRIVGWNSDGTLCPPLADITGIAHITGGGVWEKLGDLLPEGVGANLDGMPHPAGVLTYGQELSYEDDFPKPLDDLHAYRNLHGGFGMMFVCATEEDARKVIAEAAKDNIRADIAGTTTRSNDNEITIMSRFREERELSSKEFDA